MSWEEISYIGWSLRTYSASTVWNAAKSDRAFISDGVKRKNALCEENVDKGDEGVDDGGRAKSLCSRPDCQLKCGSGRAFEGLCNIPSFLS